MKAKHAITHYYPQNKYDNGYLEAPAACLGSCSFTDLHYIRNILPILHLYTGGKQKKYKTTF